jgi:hypothetical protein
MEFLPMQIQHVLSSLGSFADFLSFASGICGLFAAWLWSQSTRVPIPDLLETGNVNDYLTGLSTSLRWSAGWNANAARWTAIAIGVGALSNFVRGF